MERWKPIPEFPNYEVSDYGGIRRATSGRLLMQNPNQSGLMCVGLVRGGKQFHRSVPKLVARAFLPTIGAAFNTPINKDGNRENNRVENLAWRPRWFATQYHQQFRYPYEHPIDRPIQDLKTGEVSENSFACAVRYGLLEKDVVQSILNRTYSWPTHQEFRVVE